MGVKVTNNAFGTLSASINTTDTTITLDSGQGARFPSLGASDYFYGTIVDTSNNIEIVKVTARSTDSMTVTRAADNTTARAFAIGDRFELRPTAALFEDIGNLDTSITINESGADVDFRVESNTDSDAFFVQGSDSRVGLKTTSPNAPLEIVGTAAEPAELRLSAPNTNESDSGTITFSENGTDQNFQMQYDGSSGMGGDGALRFYGSNQANEMLSIARNGDVVIPSGKLGINVATGTTPTNELDVNGDMDISGHITLTAAKNIYMNNTPGYIYMGQASGVVGYIRNQDYAGQSGQITIGSDDSIDFVETDVNNLAAYISTNNGRYYGVGFNTTSDERVKENITTISNALDKVKAMRGCTYTRTDHHPDIEDYDEAGVIAQEVETVFPVVVNETKHEESFKTVNYSGLVGLLIQAVKEQQDIIDDLKARIETLEGQ